MSIFRDWQQRRATDRQRAICRRHIADFAPPGPEALIATFPSVIAGHRTAAGVRYPDISEHRSGWILYAPDLDEEITTSVGMHAGHFFDERPDIYPYLALPAGWRFTVGGPDAQAWFDPTVLTEDAALRDPLDAAGGSANVDQRT